MPSILFIPDRFTELPDVVGRPGPARGAGRCGSLRPARADPLDGPERRLPRGGLAVTEAGLAHGLVLFHPYLNSMPEDVEVDFSDLPDILGPWTDLLSLVHDPDPDPGFVRAACLQVVRDLAGPDLPPAQLELALAMTGDHALELFADLQATTSAMAAAGGAPLPDPPWITHPRLDRLSALTVPVTAVVTARGRGVGRRLPAGPATRRW